MKNASGVYLVNKHIVQVIGEAAGKHISQLTKQELLLIHSFQLVVACRKETEVSLTDQLHAVSKGSFEKVKRPGRRATFIHCSRASEASMQASIPLGVVRSPSCRALICPFDKSM